MTKTSEGVHLGTYWLVVAILCHVIQFSLLLTIGHYALKTYQLVVMVIAVVMVVVLLVSARMCTVKLKTSNFMRSTEVLSPKDETDVMSDNIINVLVFVTLLEGAAFSIYPTASAGRDTRTNSIHLDGFRSVQTMTQVLAFASVTLYAFHRILRPANRLDPLRTILEIQVVAVWYLNIFL